MAHGSGSSEDTIYVKLRAKTDKEVDPHFLLQLPGDKPRKEEKVTWIEGCLVKAETDEYEWEGEMRPTFVLHFKDGNENYKLEASWSSMGRSLINSLLGIEKFGKIRMRVYTSKDGYASIYVENNGEKAGWAFEWDKIKDYIETYTGPGGKEMTDYTKLNERFAEYVDSTLAPRLESLDNVVPEDTMVQEEEVSSVAPPADDEDDLPF